MIRNFFESVQVVHVAPDSGSPTTFTLAAGTTDVNSSSVDALGFSGVAFLVSFGDNVDTGTFTGKIQGSVNGSTGWTDITGASASFTAGATDTDNEHLGVSCPVTGQFRYYRLAIDRGTANTVIANLLAFLVGADRQPVTQSTSAGQFIQAPTII